MFSHYQNYIINIPLQSFFKISLFLYNNHLFVYSYVLTSIYTQLYGGSSKYFYLIIICLCTVIWFQGTNNNNYNPL